MSDTGINTDRGQKAKEQLLKLVQDKGYANLRQFCIALGLKLPNLYSNLDGTWDMSIKRMFRIANMLEVPIDTIIGIFYPDEFAENKQVSSC